jgi:hypothetical protein
MAGCPLFVYPDSAKHQNTPAACRSHSININTGEWQYTSNVMLSAALAAMTLIGIPWALLSVIMLAVYVAGAKEN